jgi:hypothetical protein
MSKMSALYTVSEMVSVSSDLYPGLRDQSQVPVLGEGGDVLELVGNWGVMCGAKLGRCTRSQVLLGEKGADLGA